MPRELNDAPNVVIGTTGDGKETAGDYLKEPFLDFQKYLRRFIFNCLIGRTGQGKSFWLWNFMVPFYIKNDKKVIIVSTPMTEILDSYDEIDEYIHDNIDNHYRVCIIDMRDNKDPILIRQEFKKLEKGRYDTVVVIMTHSYWSTGTLSGFLIEKIKEYGEKAAFFADEIHTHLTSCGDNYKRNMGHSNGSNNYEAAFYNKVAEISSYTSHVWGLTATPTAEQERRLTVGGKMEYRIINKHCPKELIKNHNAYYRDIKFTFTPHKLFRQAIDKLVSENQMLSGYDMKKTMLVKCTNKGKKAYGKDADVNAIKNLLIEHIKVNGYFSSDEKCIAVMTMNDKYIMSTNGSIEKLDDQGIKDALNDPKHPATFVLVVQKGTAGMNVHTLKSLVSFRAQDTDNGEGEFITNNSRQLMGRLVRMNDKRTPDNERAWIIANSLDMVLPDTDMLREAVRQFKEDFFSVDEMSFEGEKEEEMVCCEVCNGTGKVKAIKNSLAEGFKECYDEVKQSLKDSTVTKFFSDVVKT